MIAKNGVFIDGNTDCVQSLFQENAAPFAALHKHHMIIGSIGYQLHAIFYELQSEGFGIRNNLLSISAKLWHRGFFESHSDGRSRMVMGTALQVRENSPIDFLPQIRIFLEAFGSDHYHPAARTAQCLVRRRRNEDR